MKRLEKLQYQISVIDKALGPVSKIAAGFDTLSNRATLAIGKIGVAGAGLFAAGQAINNLMAPSIEMDRALGEVKSLGVRDEALRQLQQTSIATSIAIGENAAEIVRSSYDIQSAIAGLSGRELSRFTSASAILAKGTKSDAATITNYMGTMYGIFQETADTMGKARWVEILSGQTANAVQMFKTTGVEMASAFSNLGAEANSHGISMAEQMAILGQLQATMSGSEAGTKYKAFLSGIGKAQEQLNMRFTDSNGKLLPMVEILQKLRERFGDTFDVAESDILKKAFGTKEATALIKLLMQNVTGLEKNINKLGNVTGMDKATEMAQAMADPWERLSAVGNALKITLGGVLQPILVPLANKLIEMGATVQDWTLRFPHLTKAVGIGVLAFFGLMAAVSAFAIAGGMAQLFMVGFAPVLAIARSAMLLFNAAMWANPVTWIVVGVIALIAALGALVYYWDDVKKAGLAFYDSLSGWVDKALVHFEKIPAWWRQFKDWLANLNPFEFVSENVNALISQINRLPGVEIDPIGSEAPATTLPSIVPKGGLLKQITNNNGGTRVDNLTIHTTQKVDGFLISDELAMAN